MTRSAWLTFALGMYAAASPLACSGSKSGSGSGSDGSAGSTIVEGDSGGALGSDDASGLAMDGSAPATGADASGTTPPGDSSALGTDGGYPAGWLYTSGGKIYVSGGGSGGTPWMGRGVNIDDIFLCGFNSTLSMASPDQTVETIVSGLVSGWAPNFLRISLAMDSDTTVVSWTSDAAQYKTPMTAVINAIGTHPGVHVLVTLRSDASMIG